ncbi:MAG TPA: hypothetical protein VGJ56_00785, partial [Reyranella sp.]
VLERPVENAFHDLASLLRATILTWHGGTVVTVCATRTTDVTKPVDNRGRPNGCDQTPFHRDAGGFGISVKLRVEDSSLSQADLAMLAKEAHEQICPYSHATRNNVDVQLEVKGAQRNLSCSPTRMVSTVSRTCGSLVR